MNATRAQGGTGRRDPTTAAKVALGLRLFNDTRMSGDGVLSCAACHPSDSGFVAPSVFSPAATGRGERRNTPSLINVAYVRALLWDGRLDSLDGLPIGSMKNALHLNAELDRVIARLSADADYPASFATRPSAIRRSPADASAGLSAPICAA